MDMKVDLVDVLKYAGAIISYLAVMRYQIKTMKISLNGLGSKMRKIELGLARIEGHLGIFPKPEDEAKDVVKK